MQALTKAELDEYFEHIGIKRTPDFVFKDQASQIAMVQALVKSGYGNTLFAAFELCEQIVDKDSAIVSVFATGFQMGREYEDRHQTANELERLLQREPPEK